MERADQPTELLTSARVLNGELVGPPDCGRRAGAESEPAQQEEIQVLLERHGPLRCTCQRDVAPRGHRQPCRRHRRLDIEVVEFESARLLVDSEEMGQLTSCLDMTSDGLT